MKTRGAATAARTSARRGSCFQKASRTTAKQPRARNSAACWKTGASEPGFKAVPCPSRTRAASAKSW